MHGQQNIKTETKSTHAGGLALTVAVNVKTDRRASIDLVTSSVY